MDSYNAVDCMPGGRDRLQQKEEPTPTPTESETQEATGMMDTMKETVTEKVDQVAEAVKESFTMDIDLDKTVADLKAEAAKMDVKSLTEVALKYKDTILEKQGQLDGLIQKLKAVPMTEKLGADAQAMTTEIKTLTDCYRPFARTFWRVCRCDQGLKAVMLRI